MSHTWSLGTGPAGAARALLVPVVPVVLVAVQALVVLWALFLGMLLVLVLADLLLVVPVLVLESSAVPIGSCPCPASCSVLGSAVRSLHSAAPTKSSLPRLPTERCGEAKQCLFLTGHGEDLGVPAALEGTSEAPVLQEQQ